MGSCPSSLRHKRKKKITIILVGLDNAGKTTTAKCLMKESVDDVTPTVGFSKVNPPHKKYDITVFDLGGGKSIRGIWRNYFAEAHGLTFVIDASDTNRIEESRDILQELIKNPLVSGKPVLLLANKQDCQGALDEMDLCDALSLEMLVNKYKTRTKVETCSATYGSNRKRDKAIFQGFDWLINTVAADYDELSSRVEEDSRIQREIEEKERLEKVERVRKQREERDKLEESQNISENQIKDKEIQGDPFRPIADIKRDIVEKEVKNEDSVTLESSDQQEIDKLHANISSLDNLQSSSEERLPAGSGANPGLEPNHWLVNGGKSKSYHATVLEALELEPVNPKKKKKRFKRYNKTAPLNDLDSKTEIKKVTSLPPVTPPAFVQQFAERRGSAGVKLSWGLAEELESVDTQQQDSDNHGSEPKIIKS